GATYSSSGMHERAIAVHEQAAEMYKQWKWLLAPTYAYAGRREDALRIANDLKIDPRPVEAWGLAETYAALGDNDEAFRWLEKAYDARFSWIPWVDWNPNLRPLRDDPRFSAMLERLKLPRSNVYSRG